MLLFNAAYNDQAKFHELSLKTEDLDMQQGSSGHFTSNENKDQE